MENYNHLYYELLYYYVLMDRIAQDLLEQWASEKLTFDSVDADLFDEPITSRVKSRAQVKSEWDHLIDLDTDDTNQYCLTPKNHVKPHAKTKEGL